MKLFSEFASCWGGGATVTPAAEADEGRRKTEEHSRTHARCTTKTTPKLSGAAAAAHWKPKLNAISENSPMTDAGIHYKKRAVKAKSKLPVKAVPPPNLAEDYRRYSQTMAVPAFAPASYLF